MFERQEAVDKRVGLKCCMICGSSEEINISAIRRAKRACMSHLALYRAWEGDPIVLASITDTYGEGASQWS